MISQPGPALERGVTKVDIQAAGAAAGNPQIAELAADVALRLGPARIWHVSSTSAGGGVAELLWSSIARQRALGLPAEWLIAAAEPKFFQLAKRIHHGLHGRGTKDFSPQDEELYRTVTAKSAKQLAAFVRPEDVVLLHDPQTAGVVPHLLAAGARVAWRCHIGTRSDGPTVDATWDFLRPYVELVPKCVFTVPDFAPGYLSLSRISVITPSIDPASAKNRELSEQERHDLLAGVGLLAPMGAGEVGYTLQDQPLPLDVPVVTQVSLWDPLKDMTGVLRTFGSQVAAPAHLVLAGPDPADIPDDPEGVSVFAEVRRLRDGMPADVRARIHLVVLTLRDLKANALVVNAIQRHSTVVVQKSFEEGFGLAVTEAMWKSRPIVASAVGGLITQLTDGVDGLLVDPVDLRAFGDAVNLLLAEPSYATRLGAAAHEKCRSSFLATRELTDYLRLYLSLIR
jgi:trehalose synthase